MKRNFRGTDLLTRSGEMGDVPFHLSNLPSPLLPPSISSTVTLYL